MKPFFTYLFSLSLNLIFNAYSEEIPPKTDSLRYNLLRLYELKKHFHPSFLELRHDIADSLFNILIPHLEYSFSLCEKKKSTECPDILLQLAKLYYLKSSFEYVRERSKLDISMKISSDKSLSTKSAIPTPHFSKAISLYNLFIARYPNNLHILQPFSQLCRIYSLLGKDSLSDYFNQEYIQHFRPETFPHEQQIDFDFDPELLLLGLENLTRKSFDSNFIQSVQFRRGELYFNNGHLIKAKELFKGYLANTNAKAGCFQNESEEYLKKITQSTKQVRRTR
jgi:hypothetical protein